MAEVEVDPINIQFFPESNASEHAGQSVDPIDSSWELVSFCAKLPPARAPMSLASLDRNTGGETGTERWFDSGPTRAVTQSDTGSRFSGKQGPTLTFLGACVEVTDLADMRKLTFELYRELLEAMAMLGVPRFVRIWNYMPQINSGTGDDECYRQFCWGRAEALGDITLPAATGIGSRDGWLRIGALCTSPAEAPDSIGIQHLENARQLSAYRYPRDYGPRSPSFARATLVSQTLEKQTKNSSAQSLLLVSGTSSIVHHQTLHAGNLEAQTAETLRNIQALFKSLQPDSIIEPTPVALRYYLRNADDLARARSSWTANAGHWLAPAWYEADICRSDLAMEVEGVFSV